MEGGDVTSRVTIVTLGREESDAAFCGLRTPAKTVCPRCWKARARAEPMPWSLQPVMRTVLVWAFEDIVTGKSYDTKCSRSMEKAAKVKTTAADIARTSLT